jgi:hypothetical protein
MRHPVSTLGRRKGQRSTVFDGVVGDLIDPQAPLDTGPCARQDADGVRMTATALACGGVHACGPAAGMPRIVCEAGDGPALAVVAGRAEGDISALAGLVGHGRDASFGGELRVAGATLTYVTELGEDLCRAHPAGAGQRHYDAAVGQCGDAVLDTPGELGDLVDQTLEHESSHEWTPYKRAECGRRPPRGPNGAAARDYDEADTRTRHGK